jgi:hypothetical protein
VQKTVWRTSLNLASAGIDFACDLGRVEGLIRKAIESGQDGARRAPEQKRELENLSKVGLIVRNSVGSQVFYQANRDAPVFRRCAL